MQLSLFDTYTYVLECHHPILWWVLYTDYSTKALCVSILKISFNYGNYSSIQNLIGYPTETRRMHRRCRDFKAEQHHIHIVSYSSQPKMLRKLAKRILYRTVIISYKRKKSAVCVTVIHFL